MTKEDKVTNSNIPYRNLTSKEYINKLKNKEVWHTKKKLMFLIL